MNKLMTVLAIIFVVLNVYAVNHFTNLKIVLIPADTFYTLVIASAALTTVLVGCLLYVKLNKK